MSSSQIPNTRPPSPLSTSFAGSTATAAARPPSPATTKYLNEHAEIIKLANYYFPPGAQPQDIGTGLQLSVVPGGRVKIQTRRESLDHHGGVHFGPHAELTSFNGRTLESAGQLHPETSRRHQCALAYLSNLHDLRQNIMHGSTPQARAQFIADAMAKNPPASNPQPMNGTLGIFRFPNDEFAIQHSCHPNDPINEDGHRDKGFYWKPKGDGLLHNRGVDWESKSPHTVEAWNRMCVAYKYFKPTSEGAFALNLSNTPGVTGCNLF